MQSNTHGETNPISVGREKVKIFRHIVRDVQTKEQAEKMNLS